MMYIFTESVKLFSLFSIVYFFSLISEAEELVIDYGLVSPFQLSQSRSYQTIYNDGRSHHDRDYSEDHTAEDYSATDYSEGERDHKPFKEIEITFVPRNYALYQKPPQDINIYLSSQEHRPHKRKRRKHRKSSRHPKSHKKPSKPKKRKTRKENLEDEHEKMADTEDAFADQYRVAAEKEREIAKEHHELAKEQKEEGDSKAAEKEEQLAKAHDVLAEQAEDMAEVHDMAEDIEEDLADEERKEELEEEERKEEEEEEEHENQNSEQHEKLDRRSPLLPSWMSPFSSSTSETRSINSPYDATNADIKKDSETATTTSLVATSSSEEDSSWFPFFDANSEEASSFSPYTMLTYFSPESSDPSYLMSMFNLFSDPTNNSYVSNAALLLRIIMFLMPGTGIVDQIYFTMAVSKIMWHAASMYYEGYGTTSIVAAVLYDSYYMTRRDESFISKNILKPGETVDISGMDTSTFLQYIHKMEYPALKEEQELKLKTNIENLITLTYDTEITDELRKTMAEGLFDATRYLALFNVEGDLQGENPGINFSEVFSGMQSAFRKDSTLDILKKKLKRVIRTIKNTF